MRRRNRMTTSVSGQRAAETGTSGQQRILLQRLSQGMEIGVVQRIDNHMARSFNLIAF